jgi:hypothetical protein
MNFPSNALSVIYDLLQGHKVEWNTMLDAAGDLFKYAAFILSKKSEGVMHPQNLSTAIQDAIAAKAIPDWLIPVVIQVLQDKMKS